MSNRCQVDAKPTPEQSIARRIRGWGRGGAVPNKPLASQVQVLSRQDLGFWGLTFSRTVDPRQPVDLSLSTRFSVMKERVSVGARQVVAGK